MKWIETIELRSTSPGDHLKDMDLQTLMLNVPAASKPYLMVLLQHATVKGDLCVHLLFDTDRVPPEGSEPGLQLIEVLRDSGLVSHKIWIETERSHVPAGNDIS